ncbi:MAG TPA: flagellar assembly protein A, partial [Patescibacteria group bacterium]|nr:flagellar assembly protein A [Patescibacteria group bacterium]
MDDNEFRQGQMDAFMDKLGARDGYFAVREEPDGYYLSVVAPQGGAPVSDAAIAEYLQKRGIRNYDRAMLIRAIKEGSGSLLKIAEVVKDRPEPKIRVVVSRDRLEAQLEIDVPVNGRVPEVEEVIEAIQNADIRYGVDYEAVEKACRNPGVQVVCARGLPPADG